MITIVGNLKGGTGKSTVVLNLALWLADQERDIKVLDLDPQGTLSDTIEVREEEEFEPRLQQVKSIPDQVSGELLIDIGSSDLAAMRKAVARAHRVVIPVAPSQADVWSTQRFMKIIEDARPKGKRLQLMAFINRADTHPLTRETGEALEALGQLKGLKVLPHRLGQRTAFRRSFSEGLGVFEMEPRGKAAMEVTELATTLFD